MYWQINLHPIFLIFHKKFQIFNNVHSVVHGRDQGQGRSPFIEILLMTQESTGQSTANSSF